MQRNVVQFVTALGEICEGAPEVLVSSAKTGAGKKELLARINADLNKSSGVSLGA